MYAGRAVERGTVREVLHEPRHPYTWGLLGSMPTLRRPVTEELRPVRGAPPSLLNVPKGCPFHPRCDFVELPGPGCARASGPSSPRRAGTATPVT
ncbi:oligopeptide/dipeptide ABC transporter ATP-binding protein [Nonomuraea dietziae]|uniref:oligopeptide/dipeptide ABC transporter ATP-binding protein n=1 Tax=Nonomuraea dietziae TaxID=65515 RepID=UPI0031E0EF3E